MYKKICSRLSSTIGYLRAMRVFASKKKRGYVLEGIFSVPANNCGSKHQIEPVQPN
jgi:hypothetical protein